MTAPRVQDALGELLEAIGFDRLARDVTTETDPARLAKYARLVAKQAPSEFRPRVQSLFADLGLLAPGERLYRSAP